MRTHIKPAAKQLVNRWLVLQDLGRQRQTHWSFSLGYLFVPYHWERPSKMGDAWGWLLKLSLASSRRLTDVPGCPRGGISVFLHPSFTDVLFFRHGHWHLDDQNWPELLKLPVSMPSETVVCSMPVFWVVWCQSKAKTIESLRKLRRCFHLASMKFRMLVISAGLELIT